MNNKKIINSVAEILKELGVDLNDPNFKDTPKRVAKMFRHFFRGKEKYGEVEKLLKKVFPSKNDQMVILKDIESFGLCPHHLVPVIYKVDIGYIPNGKVLGLSKLGRLAILLAAYPKLQEDYTKEIADSLEGVLEPLGIMVVVRGIHGCIRCRGIEMDSLAITSDCRGVLREESEARAEFLKLTEK